MFHVLHSTEHDQYACIPVGKKIPFDWSVVHTAQTKEEAQEWVWQTVEFWDRFNEMMDRSPVKSR